MPLKSWFSRWLRDESGNFTIMTAISGVPIVMALALAMTFYQAYSVKVRYDEANDTAVVAAAQAAVAFMKQNPNLSGSAVIAGAISAGEAAGSAAFEANLGTASSVVVKPPTINLTVSAPVVQPNGGSTQNASQFTATSTYSAVLNVPFASVFGGKSLNLSGTAQAVAQMPVYMDIHIVIDNSASMGIGASTTDQDAMVKNVNCNVACHQPWNEHPSIPSDLMPNGNYDAVRAIKPAVQLRIDVVKAAVVAELQQLQSLMFPNQVRVAVYTFSNRLVTIQPLTATISEAIASVQTKVDLVAGYNTGGTYSSYALQTLNSYLASPGDGTSPDKRIGNVLFFTDGIQDATSMTFNGLTDQSNGCSGPNYYLYPAVDYCEYAWIEPIDPSYCTPIKSKGYNMYTLDFQYLIDSSEAGTPRFEFITNQAIPAVAQNMVSCASNGAQYHATATTPQDFDSALDTLMKSILQEARITM